MSNTIHDWTGAYAAHSLDGAERAEFEAHLRDCAQCREEVALFEETLAHLGSADADAMPDVPAHLGASIMDQIAHTPQESTPPHLVERGTAGDTTVGTRPAGRSDARGPGHTRPGATPSHRRGRRGSRMLLAAAAVLAVAAVGVSAVLSIGGPRSEVVALANEVREAPDAVTVPLGVGDAELVYSAELGAFAASGDAPALDEGLAYQLWLVNADGTIGAGPTFADGSFTAAERQSLDGVNAIAVSVEPVGGSAQPTTDPIAAAEL